MGDAHIPSWRKGVCKFCNRELDIEAPGVHQWTAGWVMNRKGGGGHGISLAERANVWAHGHCVSRAASGYGQREMFG